MRTIALLCGLLLLQPSALLAIEMPKLILSHLSRLETSDDLYLHHNNRYYYPITFTQHQTSLGTTWRPISLFEIGVKGTNEFRYCTNPPDVVFSRDEIVFDNLYLKIYSEYWRPITLTIGRQDIKLGEGWLVADGTPLDKTRTKYFNAVRIDFKPEAKTTVTGFYVYMDKQDMSLPIFKDRHRLLTEQVYEGGGIWIRRDWPDYNLNAYFLQKNDHKRKRDSDFSYLPRQKINAFGLRGEYLYNGNLHFTAEGALQQGDYRDKYRQSYGFLLHLRRDLPRHLLLPRYLELGEIMMDGQNSSADNKVTEWNPMWGRTPIWSESYVYTLENEQGYAYWSNYRTIYAEGNYAVTNDASFTFIYRYVWAISYSSSNGQFGNDRGRLLIGKLDYRINSRLTGRCVWERFEPKEFHTYSYDPYLGRRKIPTPYSWIAFEISYNY